MQFGVKQYTVGPLVHAKFGNAKGYSYTAIIHLYVHEGDMSKLAGPSCRRVHSPRHRNISR